MGEVDAVQELLLSGDVTGARAAAGHRVVAQQADALRLLPEAEASVTLAEVAPALRAAAAHDGELLVLTGEALAVVAAEDLAVTPLAEALGEVPDELSAAGDTLWIRVGETLWMLRGGLLSRVELEGRVLTGPLAATAVDGVPLLWVGAEDGLVVVDLAGNVHLDRDAAVTALAVDAGGGWVVADGELVRATLDGAWRRWAFGDPVTTVTADPSAPGAWALAGEALVRATSAEGVETFERLDADFVPAGIATDPLGRLLAWDGDLHRVTAGRLVEVLGLEDGDVVDEAASVTLLPTAPEDVDALVVTVDDTAIDATREDDGGWTARVDAANWADGERHTLVATATYTDGRTAASAPLRFSAGALGEVGWAAHVEPIYQAECAVCHAGDTATLLDSSALWQERIEDILHQVETGAMPLADDPLTDGEIAVITAWRDGGFLP